VIVPDNNLPRNRGSRFFDLRQTGLSRADHLLARLVVKDPAEAIGAGAQALGEASNRHFSGSRAFQVCVTDPDAGAIYGVMCVAPAIGFQLDARQLR
jgi:hypothetical protein